MRVRVKIFICLFISCLFVVDTKAQQAYSRALTTQDGLIHPQITHLFKDSRGYLWVSTKGGISRFNGRHFENYYFGQIGLSSMIFNVLEDSKSQIWATNNQGIAVFDGRRWESFHCPTPLGDFMNSALRDDSLLYVDQKGNCWVFGNKTFTQLKFVNTTGKQLRTSFYCPIQKKQYFTFRGSFDLGILQGDSISIQQQFKEDVLSWNATQQTYFSFQYRDSLLHIFDLENKRIGRIQTYKPNYVVKIVEDGEGDLTVWNGPEGILSLQKELHSLFPGNYKKLQITALISDATNYWIGTENGLLQLPKTGFVSFPNDVISNPWGVTEEEDGSMFIADFQKGVFQIDGLDRIKQLSTLPRWYPHPVADDGDRIFLNNEQQIFEWRQNRFVPINKLKENLNGFTASEYLYWSKKSERLICGQRGGIWVYDPVTENEEKIAFKIDDFKPHFVSCIQEFSDGELFAGSHAGLVRFDTKKNNFEYLHSNSQQFPVNGLISMKAFRDSVLFLGATNGLWIFDRNTKSCLRLLEGEIRNQVNTLEIYKDSLLIAGHLQGLTFLDLKAWQRGQWRYYTINQLNGFPGQMPRQNAAYIDSRGRYWFSAFDRLSRLELDHLKFHESIPIIRFTRINSDTLPFDLSNVLCSSGRNIQIAFEWIGPEQTMIPEFRYRLNGKTDWSSWSELTVVSLPELASGHYKLELETRWKAGADPQSNVSSFHFQVDQVLWEEPYFNHLIFGMIATLLSVIVYFFYRSRLHAQKYQHLELESKYHQARMLAAQLNPHFTSNFLNTVVKSIEYNDPQTAEEKIVQTSAFLRKFLGSLRSKEKNGLIPLQDELEIVRIYLEMENVLHSGKLEWSIEMKDEFDPYEWLVPPMILQPYVENAIVWGIDLKIPIAGKIRIQVNETEDNIDISIQDNGVGIEASQQSNGHLKRNPEESGAQIVRDRLQLLKSLGIFIQCEVQSDFNGTQVFIKYPKIKS